MCKEKACYGLRMFMFGVLELIKSGEFVSVADVLKMIEQGVGSKLSEKYKDTFDKIDFCENTDEIDEYYRQYIGLSEDNADRKYMCDKDDGLYLVIKLALNKI